MNEYDRRQLGLMLTQIGAYEAGRVDLSGLITNLESLRHALQKVPDVWLEEFWSQWGELEEVYSLAIERGLPIESPANRLETNPAIERIKQMIVQLLDKGSSTENA